MVTFSSKTTQREKTFLMNWGWKIILHLFIFDFIVNVWQNIQIGLSAFLFSLVTNKKLHI